MAAKKEESKRAVEELAFEEAMLELEQLVAQMDDGTLSLEQSLSAYRRGAALVKHCQAALEAVREQVQVLDGELLRSATVAETGGIQDAR